MVTELSEKEPYLKLMRILKKFEWVFRKRYIITSHDNVDATISAVTTANAL